MLSPGPVESTVTVGSISYDPVQTNNVATATVTVGGSPYSVMPSVAAVMPNLVQAGSADTTLTVTGTGFSSASTVLWNGSPLPTAYVSSSQLTASVAVAYLKTLGWGQVSVSNPAPGGGQSSAATVSIYQVVNVPASGLIYDPFTRKLYAAIPSTSTTLTGNSLVAIDPATGTIGTPVPVGNGPGVMAESGRWAVLVLRTERR
jgi:trimeric autotransporter adhesin